MTTRAEPEVPDPGLDAVKGERRRLINLAYRLLGSLAEAEDAVQETYARWYAMPPRQREAIENPRAWLSKVASRVCLNLLGSARARRETYVGEWIPEPLPEHGTTTDPADRITLDESVSMAFLVVLESMTPAERVAFILHDVFRYPFAEVAEIVGRTPAASRQLASSARRRIRAAQPPADSGGLVNAVLELIKGGEQIARASADFAARAPGLTLLERTVSGQPGLVVQRNGGTVAVIAFDFAPDRIRHIWIMLNPEKLRPWTR
jgi:RNA polymerase sigma factor (sigma-70 family)